MTSTIIGPPTRRRKSRNVFFILRKQLTFWQWFNFIAIISAIVHGVTPLCVCVCGVAQRTTTVTYRAQSKATQILWTMSASVHADDEPRLN